MNKICIQTVCLYGSAIIALMIAWLANSMSAELPNTIKSKNSDYGPAIAILEEVIADELEQGILSGVSIALIEDQQVVLSAGYGWADKRKRTPAAADTIYRVGSISKVFTALAAMQLVERGIIDLDVPLEEILPNFRIVRPFEGVADITLRQLMCHRSGMVRESPVGGYFDDSEPSMDDSIASLNSCVLVNPPNTKTRYSNIGVTIVGQAVEQASGSEYEQYMREHLLDPLGMTESAWRVDARVREKLATGYMRVADGRGGFAEQEAPQFELGTTPAGNLYSNANEMARFAKMLLAEGQLVNKSLVRSKTLQQMAEPQLTDEKNGFGLGFFVGRHGPHRTIQHTGAVYGFTASLVVLLEEKIAVVVLANSDLAAGRVKRITDAALNLILSARSGEPAPKAPETIEIAEAELSKFVGQFESAIHWAEFKIKENRLTADISGQPLTLRPIGPLKFEIDGRLVHRGALEFKRDDLGNVTGFSALGQEFSKVTGSHPALPDRWQQYLGCYGPEFIPLVVSARHGHLYAMTENEVDYRLTPVNAAVFKMPEGLYADEYLVFEQTATGQTHAVTLANMLLKRQPQLTTQSAIPPTNHSPPQGIHRRESPH